ncbi:LysE family translocator [Streptosporangium sp. G12]
MWDGPRAGLLATAGVATSEAIHIAVAAAGLTALFAAVPFAFTVLRIAGAAYLIPPRGSGADPPRLGRRVGRRDAHDPRAVRCRVRPHAVRHHRQLHPASADARASPVTGTGRLPDVQRRGPGPSVRSPAARWEAGSACGPQTPIPPRLPSVGHPASNAICRKLGFFLLGECDFEYPPGTTMRCNDWRLDL